MRKLVAILLILSNTSFGQVNLNLGLRAYYPFSGNANDVSGNNNNPVFNNATLTADRLGNPNSAYHFNGTNNYMRIPNSPTLNANTLMSIALWVKPNAFYTGPCANNAMVMKGDADYLPGNYFLRFADAVTGCTVPNYTQETFYGLGALATAPYVKLNQWYSVVWTCDGANIRMYVNCELTSIMPIGTYTFTNSYDLFFGHLNNATYPYWLNGDLDEVRIYDRALTMDEVHVLGGCPASPCNSWLSTPSNPAYVTVGDLDITGNQLTVECNVNRMPPLNSGLYYGHLVSKHTDPTNANYALSLTGCEITTTNGYKITNSICDPDLGKTYHVAMVYDGINLKFYRNGFLMSQVPCTGNLVTNDLLTTIGEVAGLGYPFNNQAIGYINEVRIWNVARTQAELRTFMNTSLPLPATQVGLKAYYVFDDLLNKQGNPAWNGTLGGSASINATNPNCNFIADSCLVATPCNNWLATPAQPAYATVGDLDIPGTQLTVEATANRTSFLSNGVFTNSDLVSKHSGPADVNYTLRPTYALITTSNGFFTTPPVCEIELNKTYHYAMVYDGVALKFYRNGFLMSQVPATGTLVQNNLNTTIGWLSGHNLDENFVGYINEVRIWNVARSQAELRTYMGGPLPSPGIQPGLQAYYTFDALTNKQGNPAWNATLGGGASINVTNPSCSFIADSCKIPATPISNIINDYTPVLALSPCDNKITVEAGTKFNAGDTVLLIQMKGAAIDSSNTAAFGTVTNLNNAGNYEFNYVKSRSGNVIELKNTLTHQYDIPVGKVQLIRVPYYNEALVTATLTCLPWDGSKGGVLVLNSQDSVTLNADIDVSGKGFRGGIDPVTNPPVFNCYESQYYYPANADLASGKGEGIADISASKSFGRGALANGGGGGNSHNSGGGGGGNTTSGGIGGYQYEGSPCDGTVPYDNRGFGGKALSYNTANNKIYLGGGGGAGHSNNPEGFQATGGNGSGIIFIMAGKLKNNGKKVIADGNPGTPCGSATSGCHEGMGGGGAAGTVLLNILNYVDNTSIETKGGKGADMSAAGFGRVGPGGGGGGGAVLSTNTLPASVVITNLAGQNGVCTGYSNNPWGSAPGQNGSNLLGITINTDNIPFKPNIDSVKIRDSVTACLTYGFKGLAYTNANAINTWQWYFGDGGTASTQNTSHTYLPGTYTVKLVVTDINGCKDSVTTTVIASPCNNIGIVINTYTPVLAFDPCTNMLTVEDASTFNVGDTVMMIQMKGASIDTTNTAAFGTITNYNNAGNYEYNYVKTKTGNNIELKNFLLRQYSIPAGKVQLIRVPYYNSLSVTSTLTCLPWDGNKGGVLVFNVKDTLDLQADVNVNGKGFKGGVMHNSMTNAFTCAVNNYYYPVNTIHAAGKGESITDLNNLMDAGRGLKASGGGGGMDPNTGGGGGGNGNVGGRGGYGFNSCPNYLTDNNWGLGGNPLIYNAAANKIFLGGGGGAGHCNNGFHDPSVNTDFDGGNGGGLVVINTSYVQGNNRSIYANGDTAYELVAPGFLAHDGMGGGGAGGTILINNTTYLSGLNVNLIGGKGGNMSSDPAGGLVGPGGGGAGGVVWVNQVSLPAAITVTNSGGQGGVILQNGNNAYGAAAGLDGSNAFNLALSFSTVAFKKNIDSVRINETLTACSNFDFHGLGYTNFSPVTNWQWYFGDGGTANTQNATHTYLSSGTFTVKLVVWDINGCRDSVTKDVNVTTYAADAGIDTTICSNVAVSVTLHGNPGATTYAWTPAIYLNDPLLQNPVATISSTTRFYLNATNSLGCGAMDSVTVTINPAPVVKTLIDTATCKGSTLILTTTGIASTWHWSPGLYVNDSTISNPAYTDTAPHTLYVTGTNAYGCLGKDTINVTVKPLPIVKTIGDTTICSTQTLTLFTIGAQTYSWSPINNLSDPNIDSPVFSGSLGQTYYVTGIAANGCKNKDTVAIVVNVPGMLRQPPGKSICAASSVQLDGFNGNTVSYLWSPGAYLSGTTIIDPIAFPPVTTPFKLVITDKACNYDSTFTVRVIVDADPLIDAGKSNDIDCAAKFATLHASGGVRYLWTPSTGLNNDTLANPIATPATTQQYIVTVINAAGCSGKDTVTVFNNLAASLAHYMPNAFAPNSNSPENRCYGLLRWLHVNELYFIIYNRWGEMMFATTNPNACWDGTYKGKPADPGTYVYYIKAKTGCGLEVQKGNFILIR